MEQIQGALPGEECAKCGGRCCRERGCSLSPEDVPAEIHLDDKDMLLTYLKSEKCRYAVDCSGDVFYLRMRTKCFTYVGLEAFGECVALTDNGCDLSFSDRPKGGRFLHSSPDYRCQQLYTLEQMRQDWEPYRQVLEEIYRCEGERLEQDGTIERCEKAYMAYQKSLRGK